MARVREGGIENIRFGWAGATERGRPHYYPVQGLLFLIEYDASQDDGNHIHTVWRDFDGDFGRPAALAYEQHNDYFGTRVFTGAATATGNSSSDWGGKAVIGVQNILGGLRLFGVYERLKYKTDGVVTTGQLTEFRRDAFGVLGTYEFGSWTLRGGWMRMQDPSCSAIGATCLDAGLGADKYSIGVSYNFSKRTLAYAYWTRQANDTFARYKLGSNSGAVPSAGGSTIGIGASPEAAGLGIPHTF